tara:strand:- start:345 stop:821 length:477 start_codon:yes stop_codon:yes gene_type:complete
MLDDLKQQLEELHNSENYKKAKEQNPDLVLVSAFFMGTDLNEVNWELTFYSKEKHKNFLFKEKAEEHEVFQKEEHELEELNIESVKMTLEEAWMKTESLAQGHSLAKAIVVLQVQNGKTIWNITWITNELKFMNVRLDAVTQEVIKHEINSLTDLRAK